MTNKIKRAIPTFLEAAKPAVVQVGDGRGFIVSAGESRYIVTAAHCLPLHPPPHLANSTNELTYPNIVGPLATDERTIWAELAADNLVDDVAVLSEPDGQELYDECKRYEEFTAAALTLGHPPVTLAPHLWENDPGTAAFVFSLDCKWQRCTVHNGGRFLRITNHGNNHVKGGMSGSPIIDANGAAIGLISTGDGDMNPSLMDCLPPWLLRKLDVTGGRTAGQ